MSRYWNRRQFIKTSGLGMIGAGLPRNLIAGEEKSTESISDGFKKVTAFKTLGRTGFRVSDIGIGTSRQYPGPIMEILLDSGVNYIDTAETYGNGASEKAVGDAIRNRHRKSLFITTKLKLHENETKESILNRFRQSLDRLKTDYVDCLLIHGGTSKTIKLNSFHEAVTQLKSENRLRFIGASNHGPRFRQGENQETMDQALMTAIHDGRFDLLLLVYNFIQHEQGENLLNACHEKNIAATIMKSNPVSRYLETKSLLEQMEKEGKQPDKRTLERFESMRETGVKSEAFIKKHNLKNPSEIRDAALRFVLNNKKVHVLNLAFHNFDDVENYLNLSGSGFTGNDKTLLSDYRENCSRLYCRHACGICESSCPHSVPVNTIMRYSHYFENQGAERFAMEKYARLETNKADLCIQCSGNCEIRCPFNVPVKSMLSLAHEKLVLT